MHSQVYSWIYVCAPHIYTRRHTPISTHTHGASQIPQKSFSTLLPLLNCSPAGEETRHRRCLLVSSRLVWAEWTSAMRLLPVLWLSFGSCTLHCAFSCFKCPFIFCPMGTECQCQDQGTQGLYTKSWTSDFKKYSPAGCSFLVHKHPQVSWNSIFSSPWFPCNISSLSFWIYISGFGQPSSLRCEHYCLSWLLLSHCNGSLSVSSLHAVSISLWHPSFFHVLPARILNLKAASQIGSAFALPHAGLRLFTGAH